MMQKQSEEINHEFEHTEFWTSYDDFIGNGAYAYVQKCIHNKLNTVAVKCFLLTGSKESQEKKVEEDFARENEILARLHHKHIIKLHGITKWPRYCGVIMEYAINGNLEDLLKREKNISWLLRLKFIKELACGVKYLHSNRKLVHGDLKPQNIVLSDGLTTKIVDFGSANIAKITGTSKMSLEISKKTQATMTYLAPEYVQNPNLDRSPSMDVYSIGMIMFEVIAGKHMYEKLSQRQLDIMLSSKMSKKHYFELIDEIETKLKEEGNKLDLRVFTLLNGLMKDSLNLEPSKRPPISAIYKKTTEFGCTENQKQEVKHVIENIEKRLVRLNKNANKIPKSERIMLSQLDFNNLAGRRQKIESPDPEDEKSLILIGGEATMKDVKKFSPVGEEWSDLPDLNCGRCHHCCVVVEGKILAIGGVGKDAVLNSVESFKIGDSKWNIGSNMKECRFKAAAAVLNSKVYVLGGKNNNDVLLDSIECLSSDQWETLTKTLSFAKFNFSTFVDEGKVFCCGGMGNDNKPLNEVEVVNFNDSSKNESVLLDVPRYGACAAKVNNVCVYLLGGFNPPQQPNKQQKSMADGTALANSISCLTDDKQWKCSKNEAAMQLSRCSFSTAVIGSTVFAVGGHGDKHKLSSLSTIESLSLDEDEILKQDIKVHKMDKNWSGHCVVAL